MQYIKQFFGFLKFKLSFLKNYRHWICIALVLGSVVLIPFCFKYAHLRIGESFVALWNSGKYYVAELFGVELHGELTVNEFTKQPFALPLNLPRSWEEFKENLSNYWSIFFSMENFSAYMGKVADVLFYITKIFLIIMPLFLIGIMINIFAGRKQNNDYGKDSKSLVVFKKFEKNLWLPIKHWFLDLFDFVRDHKVYLKILAWIWAYSFNIISIVISFLAYYLYFVAALKTPTIYIQFVKLLMDLSVMINFIPTFIWIIIGIIALDLISRKIAHSRLYHRERCNRGFINERCVVTFVAGTMGAGKTMQITDMALSTEVQFRDMAFEIILETDMKFPFFPWIHFENALKRAIARRSVHDLPTCRRFVKSKHLKFRRCPRKYNFFGYDYERYGVVYDDKLKLTNIWQALEDYACAYFIYTVQSSLLLSNYSIRTDMQLDDLGNFPLWNGDFFKRDSRLIDSYSRHAHILDFDMLRLGRKMLEDNPNRNAFGFGVYIVSEIDKERKNTPELKEVKANADECNQKNDLFNVLLKMSRHACVVANRVFIKIFADLQRPDSLGADARELGEIVEIKTKSDSNIALPFFAPFYFYDLLFGWLLNKFKDFYIQHRHNRGDNTLFVYLLKSVMVKFNHYRERTINVFGSQTLTVEVENGARDGDVRQSKYYRQSKKIYSKRYSTDCLSGIFENRAADNFLGISDIREYAGIIATPDELSMQNSHFQKEIQTLDINKKIKDKHYGKHFNGYS